MRIGNAMRAALAALAFTLAAADGYAQAAKQTDVERAARAREREQLRKLQADNERIAKEKSAVEAELQDKLREAEAKLTAAEASGTRAVNERAALRANAQRASDRAAALDRELAELKTALEAERAERAELAAQLRALGPKLNETTGQLKTVAQALKSRETENAGLEANLAGTRKSLDACEAKNVALYRHSREFGERIGGDALRTREKIFGLGGVAVENMLEEYRDRIDSARVPPGRVRAQ